jgi:hypothetical protein
VYSGWETEEFFGRTAEELHEQEVVERVLGVSRRAHQSQQPVSLRRVRTGELAMKELKHVGGIVALELGK